MTDLSVMMESKSLNECKDEICSQVKLLAEHDNEMKAALIASFLLQASLQTIKGINPEKFLNSLRDELNKLIKCGEEWEHDKNMLREHLEKNKDVVSAFGSCEREIPELSERIDNLLKDYEAILKRLCMERSRKSIAEIEKELHRES